MAEIFHRSGIRVAKNPLLALVLLFAISGCDTPENPTAQDNKSADTEISGPDPFFEPEGATLEFECESTGGMPVSRASYQESIRWSKEISTEQFARRVTRLGKKSFQVLGEVFETDIAEDFEDTCGFGFPYNCASSPIPNPNAKGQSTEDILGNVSLYFTFKGAEYMYNRNWEDLNITYLHSRVRIFKRHTGLVFDFGQTLGSNDSPTTRKVLASFNGSPVDTGLGQRLLDYVNGLPSTSIR